MNRILDKTGQNAFILLEAVVSAADVFPPLKSAASGALHIAKLVKGFKSNMKDWNAFGNYVQDHVVTLFGSLPYTSIVRKDMIRDLEQLVRTLETISKEIEELQRKSRVKRFKIFLNDPGRISEMRQRLDESINVFMVSRQLITGADVATILDAVQSDGIKKILDENTGAVMSNMERFIATERRQIENTLDISILQYTRDAAWNGSNACLVNTRNSIVDGILEWVRATDINGSEKVYLLADVLGCGKTALAHTVAERCFNDSVLLSSFFFNREAGRTSRDFISTLARDLGRRSNDVAKVISAALRKEPDLARSQSITRLFQKVIFEPVTSCHIDGPLVIVVDALDESDCQKELLAILRDDVPNLPGTFRFFITSRPERDILRVLCPSIQPHELGIHEGNNLQDIAVYTRQRLFEIALENDLPKDWPGEDVVDKFLEKAEGLFIWVATVCDYLFRQATYPDETLERLLDSARESSLPPEKKMDGLYSTILARCDWEDGRFAEGYQQVMGAITAVKEPISLNVLQAIHGPETRLKPQAILRHLASLLTGMIHTESPVRILHESFREFITLRSSPPRHIHAKEHSARLAVLCLRILRDTFAVSIKGTGYLLGLPKNRARSSAETIPDLDVDHISEASWYAIKFWSSHILKVADLDEDMIKMLEAFLPKHLITWVEVLVSKESYTSLIPVRRWLHTTLPKNWALAQSITNKDLAKSLQSLSILLDREGRKQEAFDVLDELSDIDRMGREIDISMIKYTASDSDDSMPELNPVSDSSEWDLDLDSDSDSNLYNFTGK